MTPHSLPAWQLQALLLLALLLGGGGVAYGMHNLAIQLFALVLLAIHRGAVLAFLRGAPRPLVLLLGASLALPLLQLVPLPPAWWQALPGRAPAAEALALVDAERAWFPLSVDRARTLVAFCSTLAPATFIVLGWNLDREARLRLVHTALALALLAFLIGAVQLSSGNSVGLFYPVRPDADTLYATFANRNSTGLLFVVALGLLVGMPSPDSRGWQLLATGAGALLVLGVVLTQSRSAMVLLVPVLGFALLRFGLAVRARRSGGREPQRLLGIGLVALVLLAIAASATMGGRAADSLQRFASLEADRLEMWDDSLYAARQYWPLGSGMGTFDEVFQLAESLEYVSPRRAGRAHNDYLELTIEGGIAALLLAAGWLSWCAHTGLRRGPPDRLWLRRGALLAIACISAQSLLDYPLRNQSLLVMAALLALLLMPERER